MARRGDLHLLCTEIHLIQEELSCDAPIETAGGVSSALPDDDVGLRLGSLEKMADESARTFGDPDAAAEPDPDEEVVPASASVSSQQVTGDLHDEGADSSSLERKLKYPRSPHPKWKMESDKLCRRIRQDTSPKLSLNCSHLALETFTTCASISPSF